LAGPMSRIKMEVEIDLGGRVGSGWMGSGWMGGRS